MEQIERYWLFTTVVLVMAALLVRLVLRERVTLQSSLSFLAILFGMVGLSLFPNVTVLLASKLRFTLVSNFIFAVGLGALGLLHVFTLMTLSRVELRSVTLVQELALLQERLERLEDQSQQAGTARDTAARKDA